MAGEGVVFDVKLRENDNVAISISYEGTLEEEVSPEQENPEENEEDIPSKEPTDGEENNGVVIE